jgi:hypothetical protein
VLACPLLAYDITSPGRKALGLKTPLTAIGNEDGVDALIIV